VSTSGGDWDADGTASAFAVSARAAATNGSVLAVFGWGGPNGLRWGRIAAGGAEQRFEERGRSRIRIDPSSLVLELHRHSAVADHQFARILGQRCCGHGSDWLKMASKMAPSAAACVTAFVRKLRAIRISILP
jgi:hypothetical protein